MVDEIRAITSASTLPVFDGSLLFFSIPRYELGFDAICDVIRRHPTHRYIFTLGDFNEGERPAFYDLYTRFAIGSQGAPGEILMCAQTYARSVGSFRLFPIMDYHPLVTGVMIGSGMLETKFGRMENSTLWYSSRNVTYVDPHQRFHGMTSRSELNFWYSAAGFIYLAHQAALIRGFNARSRRIVVYSRLDLGTALFLKLIFTFEAIGVHLVFVYEEDLAKFSDANLAAPVEIFSRSGDYSLLMIDGVSYYSDKAEVALRISEAQADLVQTRGVYQSVEQFMTAFDRYVVNSDRQEWRRRAGTARDLFQKFSGRPISEQQVILETYVERWRSL
ncbi:hypothetical protein OG792_25140 [Micromonospora sp. NBC_01699]|uniref:hypothetical protein n=1 Tax=Micromonospora sp. NBC_01699 TaxID=2975984 RepID=UPI002E28EF28|nr:hypothetical protein [Micromonospora sp. NBC_01699]